MEIHLAGKLTRTQKTYRDQNCSDITSCSSVMSNRKFDCKKSRIEIIYLENQKNVEVIEPKI